MPTTEDVQHDILLIITVALAILFATGFTVSPSGGGPPLVIPD